MNEPARIGLYRRVSTRHQLDNDRYAAAFRDMAEVVQRYGGEPVEYDEGGHARSGGTIRGRKVFVAMLADVAAGELDGIAAPDVRSLSRGEWMIDGKAIADTLIQAGAILITRDGRLDLRRPGDLRTFQDRLYWAMQERTEVRRRFYEGQVARARSVIEGGDQPWGRHRTMLGHKLQVLVDANDQPRITNRGQAKRAWVKDPGQANAMDRLIQELDIQLTRGALFTALFEAGIEGPDKWVAGGWTKRSLRTLLNSPYHRGLWPFVRTTKSNVWYGLDPRSDDFDVKRVIATCPDLAYWTSTQAQRWETKFLSDNTRRPPATRTAHPHSVLGLLRCPRCHSILLGKGKSGYICPSGAKGRRSTDACLPIFTVGESTAHLALRDLLPLITPHLSELREAARDSLRRRNDGSLDVQLRLLDNEEEALLDQLQAMASAGRKAPDAFTRRLIEIADERDRALTERDTTEQVAQARIEAERALAGIDPDDLAAVILPQLSEAALGELYRAFFEWIEVRPNGVGRVGGQLVAWKFHNQPTAGHSPVVEDLVRLLGLAAA